MGKLWTSKENAVIRTHYASKTARGCAELLPGRTVYAIRLQAAKLGVLGTGGGVWKYAHLWPLVEAMYLERVSVQRISQETGIAAPLVTNHITRHGLTDLREMAMVDRIAELKAEHVKEAGMTTRAVLPDYRRGR